VSRRRDALRRRVAVATWRPSRDGRIYTRMAIDVTATLAYIEDVRARTGERITVTHVLGAALGRAIRAVPEVRGRVFAGRILPFETCDIGFAVDIEGGTDLAPIKVRDVDTKTPLEVARELAAGAEGLRAGRDPHHSRSAWFVRYAPPWTLRPLLGAASVLVGGLGVGAFGQPPFPLGCAFVSNLGSLDLDEGFLAPVPFARVPLYVSIGAVRDDAVAVDGAVVVRPQIVVGATADHRLVDGAHAGRIARIVRDLMADPSRLDRPSAAAGDQAGVRAEPSET